MSADDWDQCPKCGPGPEPRTENFREDYELGFWDEKFRVVYKGRCLDCGYVKEFVHEEPL